MAIKPAAKSPTKSSMILRTIHRNLASPGMFQLATLDYQRVNLAKNVAFYKVVPPSYKLVYKPINYRYITYKP